jgi:hypothetical protein
MRAWGEGTVNNAEMFWELIIPQVRSKKKQSKGYGSDLHKKIH